MLMRCWVYSLLLQANHSALLWQPIRNSCCKDIAGDGCSRGILEKLFKGMIAERLPNVEGSKQHRQQGSQDRGKARAGWLMTGSARGLWEGKGAEPVQQLSVRNCTQAYAWADGARDLQGWTQTWSHWEGELLSSESKVGHSLGKAGCGTARCRGQGSWARRECAPEAEPRSAQRTQQQRGKEGNLQQGTDPSHSSCQQGYKVYISLTKRWDTAQVHVNWAKWWFQELAGELAV